MSASVTVASGCAWTASSSVAWVTVLAGASGTGNGAVAFSVAANPGSVRTGTVTVAGQTFTVTQAAATTSPCTYTIGPPDVAIAAQGGTGTVAVSTTDGCAWTASSNAAWVTVTAGASGTGNGAVAFSVGAESGRRPHGYHHRRRPDVHGEPGGRDRQLPAPTRSVRRLRRSPRPEEAAPSP